MTDKEIRRLVLKEVKNLLNEQKAVSLEYYTVAGALNEIKKQVASLEGLLADAMKYANNPQKPAAKPAAASPAPRPIPRA